MSTNVWEMTPQQLTEEFGPYHGQTKYLPRPTGEFADKQRTQWDVAEADRKRIEANAAETEARLDREAQAKQDARAREHDERRRAERDKVETIVRGRYFQAAAATEEAWERNRDRLVDQEIERMSTQADEAARGRFAAMAAA